MESSRKKSVRFSFPFVPDDNSTPGHSKPKKEMFRSSKHIKLQQASQEPKSIQEDANSSKDSWDEFDIKMNRSKAVVRKDQNNFAELSSSQNQSLQIDDSEFSTYSFQDAKDIIERDEQERLVFMNSNLSFSDSRNHEGIDEVDAPSLLSITSYFQEGSSFPDSFLLGGNKQLDEMEPPSQLLNDDSFQSVSRRSSARRQLSRSSPIRKDSEAKGVRVQRKDSLAKFFIGPESDGMGANGIVDYVLDYCKRRASTRLSTSAITTKPVGNTSEASNVRKPSTSLPESLQIGSSRLSSSVNLTKPSANISEASRNVLKSSNPPPESRQIASSRFSTSVNSTKSASSISEASKTVIRSSYTPPETLQIPSNRYSASSHSPKPTVNLAEASNVLKAPNPPSESLHISSTRLSTSVNWTKSTTNTSHPTNVLKSPSLNLPPASLEIDSTRLSTTVNWTKPVANTLQSSNVQKPSIPESLQIVPATSTPSQQQLPQQFPGSTPCTCAHHHGGHGQQLTTNAGVAPGVGIPIVIHIHLPCAMTSIGSVGHPVSTPSGENPNQ